MKVKTQSKKVNKSWLNDHVNDPYVKLAKKEGYRARAAYKLKEIDEQLGLIKPGHLVVDLGSTPGAWSQYVRRRLSPDGAAVGALNGTIIAVDILPMEPVEGVLFINGDFREPSVLAELETALQGRMADVVVSDMAPNLSGGHLTVTRYSFSETLSYSTSWKVASLMAFPSESMSWVSTIILCSELLFLKSCMELYLAAVRTMIRAIVAGKANWPTVFSMPLCRIGRPILRRRAR